MGPYEKGKKNLTKLIDQNRILVSDNPVQVNNLKAIENLISFWNTSVGIPEIGKRLEVNQHTSTMEELIALIEKGTGKKIMNDICDQLKNFKAVENELMATRRVDREREIKLAEYLITFGTLIIIICSHIFSLMLAGSMKKTINFLQATIKDIGGGILPDKAQIDTNYLLTDLK